MDSGAEPGDLSLQVSRLVDVPAEILYRCWTEPDLVVQWFTPAPWKTTGCEIDLRVGGAFVTQMKSPEGQEFPHAGVFLEIVPNRKLIFTDALLPGWRPSAKPFVVATITFTPEGSQTRYVGRVDHWTEGDRDSHLNMGFHDGWNKALDQLLDVAGKGLV